MRDLPILVFTKDGYALAAPAVVLDRIEEIEGKKYLWLRNMKKGIPVDDVLDLLLLPLELLHPLPFYIRSSLRKKHPVWSKKTLWGIVNLGDRLFPIVDLKAIAEDLEHEGP
jgi:hypothetical protein